MVVNDDSPELRSRASLIQTMQLGKRANTNVLKSFLVWSAESRSCRESHKSQEPQGSAKLRGNDHQPMAMWDRSLYSKRTTAKRITTHLRASLALACEQVTYCMPMRENPIWFQLRANTFSQDRDAFVERRRCKLAFA